MNTETVNTHELNNGDIVLTWGMRVQIANRAEFQHGNDRMVVRFDGLVLNAADLPDNHVVSVGFRTDSNRPEYARGTYWAIQGNDLARWTREAN